MAYEIIGETIKSATSIKIGDIFKVETTKDGKTTYTYPKRYKENITKPVYPSFWITQLSQNIEHRGVGIERYAITYLINIQYRVAENTETITNLRTQLDAIGFKLNTELTELDLDVPTKTKERRYEIVDGVLQFFFNITVFATPETEEQMRLRLLDLTTDIIDDNEEETEQEEDEQENNEEE